MLKNWSMLRVRLSSHGYAQEKSVRVARGVAVTNASNMLRANNFSKTCKFSSKKQNTDEIFLQLACLNRSLLEFTARKLRKFVLKLCNCTVLKLKSPFEQNFCEILTLPKKYRPFKKRTQKLINFLYLWDPCGRFTPLELFLTWIYY